MNSAALPSGTGAGGPAIASVAVSSSTIVAVADLPWIEASPLDHVRSTSNVSFPSATASPVVRTVIVATVSPAANVTLPALVAVKSDPPCAVPSRVCQPTCVSVLVACDRATVNSAGLPSCTGAGASTDMAAKPSSFRIVTGTLAGVTLVRVPAVKFTVNRSDSSARLSWVVGTEMSLCVSPAANVSVVGPCAV